MKDDSILPCPLLSLAIWTEIVYSWPVLGQFLSWDVCVSRATQNQNFHKEIHCLWLWTDPALSAEMLHMNGSEGILQCWTWPCFRVWPHTDVTGDTFHSKRPAVIQSSKSVRDITEVSLQTAKKELSWLRLLRYLSAAQAELCGNWCLWELKGTPYFAKDQKPWS